MKQLKGLLKEHMSVKPACMFDNSIKAKLKIMYAYNG